MTDGRGGAAAQSMVTLGEAEKMAHETIQGPAN